MAWPALATTKLSDWPKPVPAFGAHYHILSFSTLRFPTFEYFWKQKEILFLKGEKKSVTYFQGNC